MRITYPAGIFLLPYAPFGLVLLTLRIFIFIHAYLVSYVLFNVNILRRFVLRSMCMVLGLIVTIDSKRKTEQNTCLPIITNHVTLFDHLVICLSEDCVTPNAYVFHWKSTFLGSNKINSLSEVVQRAIEINHRPVHLLPEKAPTGLSDCILKFDHTMLTSMERVQPVALKVRRLFPIKLTVHPINWIAELLWQFFTPFTCYHLKYLTPISRIPDEGDFEFASRIRSAIANALNATLSPMNAEDLADFDDPDVHINSFPSGNKPPSNLSSLSASPLSSAMSTCYSSSTSLSDTNMPNNLSEGLRFRQLRNDSCSMEPVIISDVSSPKFSFDHLIPRITEILNDVPLDRIRKALLTSQGDVEAAIDNILEDSNGVEVEKTTHISKQSTNLVPPSQLSTAASEFLTDPTARQVSLKERRQALISHARKLFLNQQSNLS